MLEQGWKAEWRELWDEARSPYPPVIAPYPERGQIKRWKIDRPIDLLVGKVMARRLWTGRALARDAARIIAAGDEVGALSEAALDERCQALRPRLMREGLTDANVVEAFALIREVTGRRLGMRHFASQLTGGLVMLRGGLAEMATGEGKTITALLPSVTGALGGHPVHVLTVNDYLAERDCAKLGPVFAAFGLTSGLLHHELETDQRRAVYEADIVYATNKDITFDYLRDQTQLGDARGRARRLIGGLFGRAPRALTMRGLHYAIVDEADSIFIDEARTPLILSATTDAEHATIYSTALELGDRLEEGTDYKIIAADRAVQLTSHGERLVAELTAGLPDRIWLARHAREELVTQAITATRLYLRDRDYIIADDKVVIVDESTGRVMPDRAWQGGLHQMVEVKEAVAITGARETLARITYQRFFRRYRRLAGMSGTVKEVAGELWADYGLRTTLIPTNRPIQRVDRGLRLCENAVAKWQLVAQSVAQVQASEGNRPVLIGTRSVEASEQVSAVLNAHNIAHRLLNARQDAEEAAIIAQAGQLGAVTVATNMAGRGTDIELPPETKAAGGLHVILTEFHETSRVDRQLYGRAGRQGDPGSCESITAIDDELYRLFAPAASRLCAANARNWPVTGKPAELLRLAAQRTAERRNAGMRHRTEQSEEQLKKSLAFTGGD